MKTKQKIIVTITLLLLVIPNVLLSQNDLNSVVKEMAIHNKLSNSINLTEIDIYSLPKFESTFVDKHDLIKIDFKEVESIESIKEADCTFIHYHEWKKINLLLIVYFPSKAGAGSPTLQFTSITKSEKIIDRKIVPYQYFIDPGYEPTQILKIHSDNQFELITREIKRDLINHEFVFKSDETKSKVFTIKDGKIEES